MVDPLTSERSQNWVEPRRRIPYYMPDFQSPRDSEEILWLPRWCRETGLHTYWITTAWGLFFRTFPFVEIDQATALHAAPFVFRGSAFGNDVRMVAVFGPPLLSQVFRLFT